MAFDWRQFLDLANELEQQAAGASNDEALLRTAVSRCYFGAFCRARDYTALRLKFAATAKPEDHGRLIALLNFTHQVLRHRSEAARVKAVSQRG